MKYITAVSIHTYTILSTIVFYTAFRYDIIILTIRV